MNVFVQVLHNIGGGGASWNKTPDIFTYKKVGHELGLANIKNLLWPG